MASTNICLSTEHTNAHPKQINTVHTGTNSDLKIILSHLQQMNNNIVLQFSETNEKLSSKIKFCSKVLESQHHGICSTENQFLQEIRL
jgi:hypothetical protein